MNKVLSKLRYELLALSGAARSMADDLLLMEMEENKVAAAPVTAAVPRRKRTPKQSGGGALLRMQNPNYVNGMPEDADHPLNNLNRASWEPASSLQAEP